MATELVNRHINRVIDDGGDVTKIDASFLSTVDALLTSRNLYRYLMWGVDARFGVKFDGSSFASKIYCLGTTRQPRGGDYTPTTSNTFPSTSSNTSYSSNSFRGTTPSWINNAASAHGFFGNGIANIIQRKSEITLLAAYQRPSGTGVATLFGQGQFSSGMYLQQDTGSSGNISFVMYNSNEQPATAITSTVAFASATTPKVVAAVFDGSTSTVYLDGVAGTPVDASAYANAALTNASVLRGKYVAVDSTSCVLVSGSQTGHQTLSTRAYSMDNQGLFTGAGLWVFEKGLTAADITALTALYA